MKDPHGNYRLGKERPIRNDKLETTPRVRECACASAGRPGRPPLDERRPRGSELFANDTWRNDQLRSEKIHYAARLILCKQAEVFRTLNCPQLRPFNWLAMLVTEGVGTRSSPRRSSEVIICHVDISPYGDTGVGCEMEARSPPRPPPSPQ